MLNVAVIGGGNMGRHHARVYSELKGVNLVAIVDPDKEKVESLVEKYNCSYYSSNEELLLNEQVEAVSVCVPTYLHFKVAKIFIEKNVNVLLEKPIASTLEEGQLLLELIRTKPQKFFIGHIERFNPAVQRLKNLLKEDKLGKISSVIIRRVGGLPPQIKDSNVVIDLAIHDIDILNYLFNKEPIDLSAHFSNNLITDTYDCAELFLKYQDFSAFIQTNWVTPVKIRNLVITGSKGYVELDYIKQTLTLFEPGYIVGENNQARIYEDFSDFIKKFSNINKVELGVIKEEPLKLQLSEFVNSLNNHDNNLASFEDGYKALEQAFDFLDKKINDKKFHKEEEKDFFCHESSFVSPESIIGKGTKVWHGAQVRETACLGENVIIAKNVYIDKNVKIGNNVKIQNNVSIYDGVDIEDGVFIGPHVCFTNDKKPRAIDEFGNLKTEATWDISKTLIKKGASIGAHSVILPGVTIGEFAMVGAGSVVTKDVPDYGLVYGNPAKKIREVDKNGENKNYE